MSGTTNKTLPTKRLGQVEKPEPVGFDPQKGVGTISLKIVNSEEKAKKLGRSAKTR
jgi:hypothetical protein